MQSTLFQNSDILQKHATFCRNGHHTIQILHLRLDFDDKTEIIQQADTIYLFHNLNFVIKVCFKM